MIEAIDMWKLALSADFIYSIEKYLSKRRRLNRKKIEKTIEEYGSPRVPR